MEQLTKNQAVATSQEAVQNQNEPQLRDENAHNDKSVHGVLNPTYQAGLRRDAVQPDIEAERKKRDEIEAGKSYCSRRFGGATCDDKSAQIYARFDKNDWRIQPAEFYRFHDAEVNLRIKKSLLKCNWTIRKRLPRCKMRLKKRLLAFSRRLHARIRKTRYMHKMRCLLINRRSLLLALRLLWKTPIFPSNSRFPRLCAKCLLKLKRLVSILPMTKSKK